MGTNLGGEALTKLEQVDSPKGDAMRISSCIQWDKKRDYVEGDYVMWTRVNTCRRSQRGMFEYFRDQTTFSRYRAVAELYCYITSL